MKPIRPVLLAALFLVCSLPLATRAEESDRIDTLIRAGDWKEAASLLEAALEKDPDNGMYWYQLAASRYHLKDWDGALEAGDRAAGFASVRADALYNVACVHGVQGRADEAAAALEQALEAGFLDFDLVRDDPDLEIVRESGRVHLPPVNEYETLEARNRVEVGYKVILPEDHDPSHAYPALVTFAPGSGGSASCDWAIAEIWGDAPAGAGGVGVHLVAPEDGWINHPSHHALEELLEDIRSDHRIEGDLFHLVGVAGAARPATTYGSMSRRYFQSLTTVGNWSWVRWEDDEVRRYPQKNVHLLVGELDDRGVDVARHVEGLLKGTRVMVLDGEPRVPGPLRAGGLMTYLEENVRSSSS